MGTICFRQQCFIPSGVNPAYGPKWRFERPPAALNSRLHSGKAAHPAKLVIKFSLARHNALIELVIRVLTEPLAVGAQLYPHLDKEISHHVVVLSASRPAVNVVDDYVIGTRL